MGSKFLGYMCLQKLYKIFVPGTDDGEPGVEENADAFAELGLLVYVNRGTLYITINFACMISFDGHLRN